MSNESQRERDGGQMNKPYYIKQDEKNHEECKNCVLKLDEAIARAEEGILVLNIGKALEDGIIEL